MRDDRKELLKKWVNIVIPALSLLLACLMGPVAFTLKATVKELVRQELTGYETVASSDARWKAHQDYENEFLKRLDHELAAAREKSNTAETNQFKLMLDLGNRLLSLDTKMETLMKENQRDRKVPGENGGP
jgi:hypothetical protein